MKEATIGELLVKETEQLLSVLKDEISLVNEYKCGRENRRERRKRERKNK